MPRIVAVFIILILFSAGPGSKTFAAGKDSPPPKSCQADLFAPAFQSSPTGKRAKDSFVRFPDLTRKQKELWQLYADGNVIEADSLRLHLITQLLTTPKTPALARLGRHAVVKATDLSYAIFREGVFGATELCGYFLNEELGRPILMPVTAGRSNGSMQIWLGYQPEEKKHTFSEDRFIRGLIAGDADLFFFSFLALNTDEHAMNMILDPDVGSVVFGFEGAFGESVQGFFRFGTKHFGIGNWSTMEYTALDYILREKMKHANFDWKKALARMDQKRLLDQVRQQLGASAARALQGRLCVLRKLFNFGDITSCESEGFNL